MYKQIIFYYLLDCKLQSVTQCHCSLFEMVVRHKYVKAYIVLSFINDHFIKSWLEYSSKLVYNRNEVNHHKTLFLRHQKALLWTVMIVNQNSSNRNELFMSYKFGNNCYRLFFVLAIVNIVKMLLKHHIKQKQEG